MLFSYLAPAIITVEGAGINEETFESAYYQKYVDALESYGAQVGWPGEKLATSYGTFQILGENLSRFHGIKFEQVETFLADPKMQYEVARKQFWIMFQQLIKRRGIEWPKYIYSMWNAGINYNEAYTRAIKKALSRMDGK